MFLDKMKLFLNKCLRLIKKISPFQTILIVYFFIVILSSLILFSPAAQTGKVDVNYIDALFVASSAFSDTGLSPLVTAETWSMFGQAIIAMLIFVGGIGVFALKYYIFSWLFHRKLSFTSKNILDKERSSQNISFSLKTIRVAVSVLFILMILFSFVLSFLFYFGEMKVDPSNVNAIINNPQGDIGMSIRFAIFHSISALNNAGFDIIGNSSLSPYYDNYGIQIIFIVLFVIGGIGYPVIFDLYSYFKNKVFYKKNKFNFSLFTKISCITYLIVVVMGLSFTYAFEVTSNSPEFWGNDFYGGVSEKSMAIFFNTMSTRNAGFATINMGNLSEGTIVIYSIMMFIGSAPSSTAGGIRTTTIAIVIMSIVAKIKNSNSIKVFHKKIGPETVSRAKIVFAISTIIIFLAGLLTYSTIIQNPLSSSGEEWKISDLMFEVTSAFGTTGLSTGLTSSLNIFSKLIIILLMFMGQMGISSTMLVWNENRKKEELYDYIPEDILIG